MSKHYFISDNTSGIHPNALKALCDANQEHALAYGSDHYSTVAIQLLKHHFDEKIDVNFVSNGTAANTLAIKNFLRSHQTVICGEAAHINTHECGSIESVIGCKLLTIPTHDGKISDKHLISLLQQPELSRDSIPRLLSISQPTEYGTAYTAEELKKLKNIAKKYNLFLHMDGARLANACATLNLSLKEITEGFDALSFGLTKNGGFLCDAIIFFNSKLSQEFKFIQKQNLQCMAKNRFVAAQFIAFFEDDLWLKNALHANKMANILSSALRKYFDIKITHPVQANMVFAKFPSQIILRLEKMHYISIVDREYGVVRLVTSFDTRQEDINELINTIRKLLN